MEVKQREKDSSPEGVWPSVRSKGGIWVVMGMSLVSRPYVDQRQHPHTAPLSGCTTCLSGQDTGRRR